MSTNQGDHLLRGYRALRRVVRAALQVFFYRIEESGGSQVPKVGAVIFCGNHPNSLLDPMLIMASTDRVVHFAAKDVLFQSRLLRPFLRIAGAVPVQRRRDHGGGALDNREMFETMYALLAKGRATGIFPEGISHERSHLAPMKTGAARIAFGLKQRYPDVPVYIVPTGLVYFNRHRFRSNVLVQYGDPEEIDLQWSTRYADDERDAVAALTERIELRLRGLTINAEDWEQARVLDAVRRLYQPDNVTLHERARVARRFNMAFPRIRDDADVRRLYSRVRDFLARKSALGIDDSSLRGKVGVWKVAAKVAENFVLMLVHLPLFVVGAPIHIPLGLCLRFFSRRFAPRSDVVATTKFVGGVASVLVVYAAVTAAVGWSSTWVSAAIAAIVLPASGWATVRVLGRLHAMRRAFLNGLRLASYRREIESLRRERSLLVPDISELVDRYRWHADEAEAELEEDL